MMDNTATTMGSKNGTKVMILELGEDSVLIPQADIIGFENTYDIVKEENSGKSVASIIIKEQLVPVFCLSDTYELLNHIPDSRSVCVVVCNKSKVMAVLFDRIRTLDYTVIKFQAIPDCMVDEETPISNLLLYRQGSEVPYIGLMLRGTSLVNYIENYQNIKNGTIN